MSITLCTFIITDDSAGTRRSELVNWYLKEMESEIESEAELMERKVLAEKVVYRLVHHVSYWCGFVWKHIVVCTEWQHFADYIFYFPMYFH